MKALTPMPAKTVADNHGRNRNPFPFEARDVTGTHVLEARNVQPATPARAVATALAAQMALPRNVPWIIRDDLTGAVLADDKPIGEQIESGAKVVLSPRAHLG